MADLKEKYVDERFPPAMIFGQHGNGLVDVATVEADIVSRVTFEQATRIVEDHNTLQAAIVKIAQAFYEAEPDAFKRFWYSE